MSINITLERLAARADQFVTDHEPLIRSLTLGASPPEPGARRQDSVVLGILGGVSALVISSSCAMIVMRYYVA